MKSKKVILTALIILLLGTVGVLFARFGEGTATVQDKHTSPGATTQAGSSSEAKSGLAALDKNGDGIVYRGPMHPDIVQDEPGNCPICGMKLTAVSVSGAEEGTVKIDAVTMQNMGVRTAPVTVQPLGRTVRTTGRFKMDEEGAHVVSLKVGGWVEKLYADYEGALVKKGQPLLELYSPKLVSTQEEYLLALRNAHRLKEGPAAKDAQRLLKAARRRLAYWDLTEAQIERLEETGEPKRTMTFYAPASGEVMHKNVTEGQQIDAGQALMSIMDLSTVWLIADIYEQDMSWVEVGTPARIELASEPGKTYRGRVDYIYHMLDEETRSAKARIELPGGHHTPFKPGAYATVYLGGQKTDPAPVVPAEAVVRTGEQELVILALGEGRFRPQEVTAGLQSGGKVQILEGLEGGEKVVTSAQFMIDSEAKLSSAVSAMASSPTEEHAAEVVPAEVSSVDKDGDGFVYQGPMHPEEMQDTPGNCPVCGMKLRRVPVEEARQNLTKDK